MYGKLIRQTKHSTTITTKITVFRCHDFGCRRLFFMKSLDSDLFFFARSHRSQTILVLHFPCRTSCSNWGQFQQEKLTMFQRFHQKFWTKTHLTTADNGWKWVAKKKKNKKTSKRIKEQKTWNKQRTSNTSDRTAQLLWKFKIEMTGKQALRSCRITLKLPRVRAFMCELSFI